MALTATDLQGMVTHWLGCPPNGYLGSGYGSALQDLLQTPLSGGAADAVLRKLRDDVPVMSQIPEDSLNIFAQNEPPDGLRLFIEVAGSFVRVDQPVAAG